jgi:hypothetical protein
MNAAMDVVVHLELGSGLSRRVSNACTSLPQQDPYHAVAISFLQQKQELERSPASAADVKAGRLAVKPADQ